MVSDRVIGGTITVASIAVLAVYTWALFFSQWSWLALMIPVYLGVLVVGVIAAWVGWTMLTTPPPVLPEEEKPKPPEEEPKRAPERKP